MLGGWHGAIYLVIFLCVWCLVACMGGEFTRHTARDAFIALLVLAVCIGTLIVEAFYG
jgi:hypothetical protein